MYTTSLLRGDSSLWTATLPLPTAAAAESSDTLLMFMSKSVPSWGIGPYFHLNTLRSVESHMRVSVTDSFVPWSCSRSDMLMLFVGRNTMAFKI